MSSEGGVGSKVTLEAHKRTGKVAGDGAEIQGGTAGKVETVVPSAMKLNQLITYNKPETKAGLCLFCMPKLL